MSHIGTCFGPFVSAGCLQREQQRAWEAGDAGWDCRTGGGALRHSAHRTNSQRARPRRNSAWIPGSGVAQHDPLLKKKKYRNFVKYLDIPFPSYPRILLSRRFLLPSSLSLPQLLPLLPFITHSALRVFLASVIRACLFADVGPASVVRVLHRGLPTFPPCLQTPRLLRRPCLNTV